MIFDLRGDDRKSKELILQETEILPTMWFCKRGVFDPIASPDWIKTKVPLHPPRLCGESGFPPQGE
jgi:hypothetical protein